MKKLRRNLLITLLFCSTVMVMPSCDVVIAVLDAMATPTNNNTDNNNTNNNTNDGKTNEKDNTNNSQGGKTKDDKK